MCQEYFELISAEVDGELAPEKKNLLHEHLKKCRHCCNTLELEMITKLYIGRKLEHTTSPAELKLGILQQLHSETNFAQPRLSILHRLLNFPKWQLVTAFAGSAAIIMIVLLLMPWRSDKLHIPPFNNNIIHQTFNNYNGILEGKLIPAVATDNRAVADLYFRYDNNFQAYVPPLNGCRLMGALFSRYTHEGMAHLVYKYDDKLIYILEADIRDLTDKDGIAIPPDVFAEIKKGDWYCERRISDYSMIMWLRDGTLCCAMTNLSNQQLISCLTNE